MFPHNEKGIVHDRLPCRHTSLCYFIASMFSLYHKSNEKAQLFSSYSSLSLPFSAILLTFQPISSIHFYYIYI